ncbi:PAS domain S-box protein [Actinoplanes sp. LDG1-06]|uniref:Sensor-like histidine kinase SenX3 n=1 Tax=Paractinoplanes ovalisporus TaxID=2810368 RepID=A0ABS2AA05_9ACTN|nr:ATP-binding protein [Actinoplanes ovalisporus]MBM2616665.1 PAS domain S-box protein [Actinoplanes ovalisporus]
MPVEDETVLADRQRLAAADRARRTSSARPMPLDGIAQLAAQLLGAPMGAVTFVGRHKEHFAGSYGLPPRLAAGGWASTGYSVGKYAVIQDAPACVPDLEQHPLNVDFGVRAFAAVPLRDEDDRPVGALAVMDTDQRRWGDREVSMLLEVAHLLDPVPVPGRGTASAAVTGLDLAGLMESLQEAFIAVDTEGTVAGFNRAARELLGWRADEVVGRHVGESVLPGNGERSIGEALERLFTGPACDHPVPRTVDLRHRDGHLVPTRILLSVVHGASGSLACAFITDRTREAAAETEAERQRSFLAALLESLDVGVVAVDVDGHILVMNRALREVHGIADDWTSDEVEQTAAEALRDLDGSRLPLSRTPVLRALRGEHVVADDLLIMAGDGRERVFAAHAQPITTGEGRRLGAVAALHEVTAARRTELFHTAERRIRKIFTESSDVPEAATAVLETVCEALRWPYGELWLLDTVTGTLQPSAHWSTRPDLPGPVTAGTIRKGAGIIGTVWESGQPLWVPDIARAAGEEVTDAQDYARRGLHTVIALPVRDGGVLLGVMACFAAAEEDDEELLTVLLSGVAAQLGLFIALRRYADLAEQLARTRNDFLTLVGHQLRTPLTSITSYAGLLAEDAATDGETADMARVIERNARDLSGVVDNLLDLAGLQSGHLRLDPSEIDLSGVVADAVASAEPSAGAAGVRLHSELPSELHLFGDAGRLRQVVANLLDNAIAYTPRGGDIRVSLTASPEAAELRVSDTGIGIPPGEHERLFERFYRASNVAHQGVPGAGLGLTLAETVAGLHHGTITVDTSAQPGASLLLRLPRPGLPAAP